MIMMVTILSSISLALTTLISIHSIKTFNPALFKKINKKLSSVNSQKIKSEQLTNSTCVSFNSLHNNEFPCVCFLNGNASSSENSMIKSTDNNKCFILENNRICFGRVQSCDIIVNDYSISRIHFEIEITDGIAKIKDCQSTNGTFLNGKRVEDEAILLPGDIIKIGETSLIYQGTK